MCTRVLWNTNQLAVMVGRTMDWPESTEPILTVLPRGMARQGGKVGREVVAENGAEWVSRYGSLVTTTYDIGTADGLNERGMAVQMLFLPSTNFGTRPEGKPAVHAGLWAQYLLDNAATVAEALQLQEEIAITMVSAHGRDATVHLSLADAGGDSTIVEYIDGRPVIHHGPEFRIMTNDPAYDEQLALLAQQDFSRPSSQMPLPGNVNPIDRFQRAAYYLALLPEPASEREAVASLMSVMRNTSVPFGAPYKDFGIYNTEYRTVANLTDRRYYFELTTSPNVMWAELDRFDLAPGAPVRRLNPDNINLAGDVSARFRKRSKAPF